jgi:hypothetical protein
VITFIYELNREPIPDPTKNCRSSRRTVMQQHGKDGRQALLFLLATRIEQG